MAYEKYVELHREHERLRWTYRAAVDLLFQIGYLATDDEYLKLKIAVDDARYDVESARRRLDAWEASGQNASANGTSS